MCKTTSKVLDGEVTSAERVLGGVQVTVSKNTRVYPRGTETRFDSAASLDSTASLSKRHELKSVLEETGISFDVALEERSGQTEMVRTGFGGKCLVDLK